jgi:hypothetical protein
MLVRTHTKQDERRFKSGRPHHESICVCAHHETHTHLSYNQAMKLSFKSASTLVQYEPFERLKLTCDTV